MAEQEKKEKEEMEENPEDLSLEDSFKKLDELLEKLEDRDLPLEEALSCYQQGVTLLQSCNEKIDTAEKKIQVMTGDGEFDEF